MSSAGPESTKTEGTTPVVANTEPEAAAPVTKKAIITGITGQDGSYLAEFLLEKVCVRQLCARVF